ncbi:MAG: sugar ABC transporter permease [Candidatus Latescibacteria bacterium]|jgi:raffinose/stachyose/melibiose transport system permease protein|nr:sugar ABC transporter permease [Candidatus Latescibacterota bacterium]
MQHLKSIRTGAACYLSVLPSLALLAVFSFLPMFMAFYNSFFEYEVGGARTWVGFDNYLDYIISDPTTAISFLNMAILTAITIAVRLSVPLIVAKLIHSLPHERHRYLYRLAFLIPSVVPGVAIQLIWGLLILGETGLVNSILESIGAGEFVRGWLSDPDTALLALACIGFPWITGFEVLIFYAGLSNIPESVHEAAALDAAVGVKKFLLIDIPLVLSQIKLIFMLVIIGGIQSFEFIFILTQGGPGFETYVPGLWMYDNAFSFQKMGYASSIGVVLFVIIMFFTVINMRYFRSAEELQEAS